MSKLIELATQLVTSQVSTSPMTTDQLINEIKKVHAGLKNLEAGHQVHVKDEVKPQITLKKAFGKNEVICLICGKGGFKTLKKHLKSHGMTSSMYRKQFNIPTSQPLTAKSYSDARRKTAVESGLADNLAKARELRITKIEAKEAAVGVVEDQVAEVAEAV